MSRFLLFGCGYGYSFEWKLKFLVQIPNGVA
jgi:hypothetical protein